MSASKGGDVSSPSSNCGTCDSVGAANSNPSTSEKRAIASSMPGTRMPTWKYGVSLIPVTSLACEDSAGHHATLTASVHSTRLERLLHLRFTLVPAHAGTGHQNGERLAHARVQNAGDDDQRTGQQHADARV